MPDRPKQLPSFASYVPAHEYNLHLEQLELRDRELDLRELELEQSRAMQATIAALTAALPHAHTAERAPAPSAKGIYAISAAAPITPGVWCAGDVMREYGLSELQLRALIAEGLPHALFEGAGLRSPIEMFERSTVHAWMLARPGELPTSEPSNRSPASPAPTTQLPATPATKDPTMKRTPEQTRAELDRQTRRHLARAGYNHAQIEAWMNAEASRTPSTRSAAAEAPARPEHAATLDQAFGQFEMRAHTDPVTGARVFGAQLVPGTDTKH